MQHETDQPRPKLLGRPPTTVAAEALHDALQAMGTVEALLAAAAATVHDPQLTRRRLHQIETEFQTLHELVRGPSGDAVVQVVDVTTEARQLVSSLSVDYPGSVGVVARAAAPARLAGTALHRILGNLVRNAMRAAGVEGRVLVTVVPGAHEVSVVVEDDGPGLGALPVIHGIGLRSVRRLVHQAGGRLETVPRGRLGGASIRVHLPAAGREMAS